VAVGWRYVRRLPTAYHHPWWTNEQQSFTSFSDISRYVAMAINWFW